MKHEHRLIAHRGLMCSHPENTLLALRAAIAAGATHVEFDVQLTADGVPVVLHDVDFGRTTGCTGSVLETPASIVTRYSAHEPERLGMHFLGETIPTLAQAVGLLNLHHQVTAFVELKRESLNHFGYHTVLTAVLDALETARYPWVLISFDPQVLAQARAHGHVAAPIGWVLPRHDTEAHAIARDLRPNYLFCNITRLPDLTRDLWPGPWQWAVYDIEDTSTAQRLLAAGTWVETGCISKLKPALEAP